jgi:predicted dehydrogenase
MRLAAVVVGTGSWAERALVPAIRSVSELDLAGCVGPSMNEADAFAAKLEISQAFDSLESAVRALQPGLVVIATPDRLHVRQTATALRAGAAVYCEKPLAGDARSAREVAALAAELRSVATVGYAFRYAPAIQALRADLEARRIGEPWLIELFEHNPQFHSRAAKPLNWKADPAHVPAGALFEYGSHVIDLALWLIGPVRRVSAMLAPILPGARLDDVATLQLAFDPPAIGTMVASWVLAGGFPGIRIRVHGSEGVGEVRYGDLPNREARYVRRSWRGHCEENVPLAAEGDPVSGNAARQLSDLVRVIEGGSPRFPNTLPTLADGVRVQEVLEAALAARESWAEVEYVA